MYYSSKNIDSAGNLRYNNGMITILSKIFIKNNDENEYDQKVIEEIEKIDAFIEANNGDLSEEYKKSE